MNRGNGRRIVEAMAAALILVASPGLSSCAGSGSAVSDSDSGSAVASAESSSALGMSPEAATQLVAYADLDSISKHGNVLLFRNDESDGTRKKVMSEDLKNAGIVAGDLVQVDLLDEQLVLPVCNNYSEAKTGDSMLVVKSDGVTLAINLGDFASAHFAEQTKKEDGSSAWAYKEGVSGPVTITIAVKVKGGADDGSSLSYTDARGDYPHLTDEQFANFRMVATTGINDSILYRTCSPVDPKRGRNTYADAAIRQAGVKTILNLSDSQDALETFPGYAQSYYASCDTVCLNMGYDFTTSDFTDKLADGLRFLAAHDGPYAIHCLEGKDRTGIVVGLLECLMGASLDEIERDYMVSFYNYYGIEPGTERYEELVRDNVHVAFRKLLGTEDLEHANLAQLTESYLRSIGLTDDELSSIKGRLGAAPAESGELAQAA